MDAIKKSLLIWNQLEIGKIIIIQPDKTMLPDVESQESVLSTLRNIDVST